MVVIPNLKHTLPIPHILPFFSNKTPWSCISYTDSISFNPINQGVQSLTASLDDGFLQIKRKNARFYMEESNADSWFINFEPDFPYFLQDYEQLNQSAPSPMILNLSSPSPECCWSNSNSDPNPSPEVCTTSPPLQLPNAVTDQTNKKKRKLPRKKNWNSRITKERNSRDGQETEKSDGSDDTNLSPTTGHGRKRSYEAKSNGDREKNNSGSADQVPQFGIRKKDHVIAERMRREKLTQRFIALSSLLPGLSRMDKASVLEDAIKYVKQLQERVKSLEAQTLTKSIQPSNTAQKLQSTPDKCNLAESTVDDDQSTKKSLPEIEVRISQQRVLIKIHCGNQKGILAKLLSEIENLGLTIVTTSAVPFTSSSINITVTTEVDQELSLTVEDVVTTINFALK
ncbi:hypothetical protein LUZ63_013190 [Rhynchospora breviuscula]|uniref:BHLH domain-containing protein n=1 Tax=Rhynchospora breviuscula TaxID=2022672 RepID=A0A9Q0C842_9POAL|nr:hypothetical protein LUZ63_013190 [Rhynchospora breviuscula]